MRRPKEYQWVNTTKPKMSRWAFRHWPEGLQQWFMEECLRAGRDYQTDQPFYSIERSITAEGKPTPWRIVDRATSSEIGEIECTAYGPFYNLKAAMIAYQLLDF